jgi:hypothetical protein
LTVPNGRSDTLTEHINFWSPESWTAMLRREFLGWVETTTSFRGGAFNCSILQRSESGT